MDESGYSDGAVAGAVLAALLFPLIALAAALVLLAEQTDPRKRSQLRRWAWGSGVWLVVAATAAVLLALY
jgi:hypothetical protein